MAAGKMYNSTKRIQKVQVVKTKRKPRPSKGLVYKFNQIATGASINGISQTYTVQGSGSQFISLSFRLSDLPQYTTFTALYDQYRITKITCQFMPVLQPPAITSYPGICGTVIDYDDDGLLTSKDMYLEKEGFKYQSSLSNKVLTRTFAPRAAIDGAAQSSGGSIGRVIQKPGQWLDCGSPAILHYGLKFFADPYSAAGQAQVWYVMAKYHVEFKNVR